MESQADEGIKLKSEFADSLARRLQETQRERDEIIANLVGIIEKQKQEKTQQDEMQEKGAADLRHEFRTYLSHIIGFSDLLKGSGETITPEKIRRYAGFINNAGNEMLKKLNSQDIYSSIEAGTYQPILTVQNLHSLLVGTRDEFFPELDKTRVSLEVKVDEKLAVNLDSFIVRLALDNIIKNAIEAYKDEPEKTIDVYIEADNGYYNLNITNRASPIPQEVQARLFERGATYGKANGTGIGLNFSRKAMQTTGGDLYLKESSEEAGTTFTIKIPK